MSANITCPLGLVILPRAARLSVSSSLTKFGVGPVSIVASQSDLSIGIMYIIPAADSAGFTSPLWRKFIRFYYGYLKFSAPPKGRKKSACAEMFATTLHRKILWKKAREIHGSHFFGPDLLNFPCHFT